MFTEQTVSPLKEYNIRFVLLSKVKTYAPGVWHVVCDVEFRRK